MVPYNTTATTTATYLYSTDTCRTILDNDYVEFLKLIRLHRMKEEENLSQLQKKPKFDRVMKMTNTDGQVRPLPTWRPMRLVSRGNIGVKNFQAR